ncbi:MAG: glycosyltransferase [Proteobacteria bacterium]|nr:glycosyltransferase [Pseudomonadota bacterium]
MALSVIVPVRDQAENAAPLPREIARAITIESGEIIFVDDGSSDSTVEELKALSTEIARLRIIQHGRNIGQSRAIRTGVRAARGDIVATLDGDEQNDPCDIAKILDMLRKGAIEPKEI